ncbi:MAG: beta-galactosidase, partial [Pseudopedobacter saltans]
MFNTLTKTILILIIAFLLPNLNFAQNNRQFLVLDTGWSFHFAFDVRKNAPKETVTVPHTWNAQETLEGKMHYTRDAAIYERNIDINGLDTTKRLFLIFDGVNSFAKILINQHFVGEHKGGYTRFCFEITPFVKFNSKNKLTIWVSNAESLEILPLTGDFNVYGGIHRPIHLMTTDKDCISPLYFGSSGTFITPTLNKKDNGDISVKTILSLQNKNANKIRTTIYDANGRKITSDDHSLLEKDSVVLQNLSINKPVKWDGKKNPYLYTVSTQLLKDQNIIDEVTTKTGFRSYHVQADSGVILNRSYYDLYGFGFHEDLAGKGSAMSIQDLKQDMNLITEIGATTLRLTHYPHSQYIYDYADSTGIVLWSEIPLVGPGGYTGTGYIKSKSLEDHAKQIMKEMIYQNYNHPSIFFWGLFNELKLDYDDPLPFLSELESLVKELDPNRLTTCATFLDNDHFNQVSDVIAWNKYYGWYGGKFDDIGIWADKTHKAFPTKPIAVSEYGAGASIKDHDNGLTAPDPSGKFHPEEWQTAFHEAHWKQFKERPFIWGKYIWDFADFGSAIRTEGDHNAINDKGLVTYDRKTKKDAFFFYKANWTQKPMIYIAEKRYTNRSNTNINIKAFANVAKATLL